MNIYSLLKINRIIKSTTLKGLGIWLFHVLRRRYLVIFFDPVLACNLRCRMCMFGNEEKRKSMNGQFAKEDLGRVAEVIFPHALKLQVGCAAEPGLFKHNETIIRLGKQYNIPYISFTTNANLLTAEDIIKLLDAGLDEFTISMHGVSKPVYEDLMVKASYEKLRLALDEISMAKSKYPNFKLRINLTANERNINDLSHFFDVFGALKIDILQMRPMQDIGGEVNFIENRKDFNAQFNNVTLHFKDECAKRGITYIAPLHLDETPKINKNSSIMEAMYWYISPRDFGKDVDWRNETFRQFCRRTHYAGQLFKAIFRKKKYRDDKLNYEIL